MNIEANSKNIIWKLIVIGIVAGVVLMLILRLVMFLTGNTAYILLFNYDYIPVLNRLRPIWLFGYVFHFTTCIVSIICLYYILKIWNRQFQIAYYLLIFTLGGAALFFLTALSPQPPAYTDIMAWIFWTFGHLIFAFVVGFLVRKWIKK